MPKIFSSGSAINSRHFLQLKNSLHTHSGTHQLSVVWSFKACRIVHWDPCFLLGLILKKTRPQEGSLQWPETEAPQSQGTSLSILCCPESQAKGRWHWMFLRGRGQRNASRSRGIERREMQCSKQGELSCPQDSASAPAPRTAQERGNSPRPASIEMGLQAQRPSFVDPRIERTQGYVGSSEHQPQGNSPRTLTEKSLGFCRALGKQCWA